MSNNRPINIIDNITPISHEKIENVNRENWEDVSIDQLYTELNILNTRKNAALYCNQFEVAIAIQQGIDLLTNLIEYKNNT